MNEIDYSSLFEKFSERLNIFIDAIKKQVLTKKATDQWSVKEVLCHITYWHENYAANYDAMVRHQLPPLFDLPGQEINKLSVSTLRSLSVDTLINRLQQAHKSLYNSIVIEKVPHMTYKKGSRTYTTEDFLEMIGRHFLTHATQVRRAK